GCAVPQEGASIAPGISTRPTRVAAASTSQVSRPLLMNGREPPGPPQALPGTAHQLDIPPLNPRHDRDRERSLTRTVRNRSHSPRGLAGVVRLRLTYNHTRCSNRGGRVLPLPPLATTGARARRRRSNPSPGISQAPVPPWRGTSGKWPRAAHRRCNPGPAHEAVGPGPNSQVDV